MCRRCSIMDRITQKRLLEALLFATAEPLTPVIMRERLPEEADLGALLSELQKEYEEHGVQLVEVGGAWAFRTAADLGDLIVLERNEERKLSKASMETLSIIAYHQPVTRAEIENIRGVSTNKGTLDILLEQNWIKPGRRRETPGRPVTWVSTNHFLDHFGLEALTDLPGLDELKASGLLDRRPAIETIPDLFDQEDDESDLHQDEEDEDTLIMEEG
ncbi:MAG: SMC-Scp complex subunit ScpB [Alphaproteobacteria bacterium]|nr:SMC-Scp complex subunit ScpB [Alphaproteobacteria bacterium]